MPGSAAANELNSRIDALVAKMDELITHVGEQDKLRRRLSRTLMVVVVIAASSIAVLGLHQAAVERRTTCLSQNSTRTVVRNLLQSAKDAADKTQIPAGLSPAERKQYLLQVSQADEFYSTQLGKVQPLKC